MTDLKRTPLYDEHVRAGGKMVEFAGYEMPIQYPTGIVAEHRAVRTNAGLYPHGPRYGSPPKVSDSGSRVAGQLLGSTVRRSDFGRILPSQPTCSM